MKVFQDLSIRGTRPELRRFIPHLEERLADGWERRPARERDVNKAVLGSMYCFSCAAADAHPAGELWIATRSDGSLYVSNILAQEPIAFTYDRYNATLQEFHDRFAVPAAQAAGVDLELGNPDPKIEDFLSSSTASLLRIFSRIANRSILHPEDRKRWNEFLTAAHRESAPLGSSMLQRWLVEEEGWGADQAADLAVEYEHARNLLEVYESQPA